MTLAALRFIEQAAREPHRPFYLHLAWMAPHPPYFVPAPYAGRYDPARLNLHGTSLRRLWEAPGAGSGAEVEYRVDGFDVAFSEVGAHPPDSVRDPVRGDNVPNGPPASGRQVELSAMIRTREWKYVHTPGREIQELYHVPGDPWELRNLYGRGDHAALVRSLRERLLDWQLRHT